MTFMLINNRTQTQQTRQYDDNLSKCIFYYSYTNICCD